MKYEIERFHVIYKNLIKMGKELDFERFRLTLEGRGFKKEERIIPTPTGPLKEYLMRDPRSLRDLIVVSIKGFVVDSWNHTQALDLLSLSYEIFEEILGDAINYIMIDIVSLYDLTLITNTNTFEVVGKLVNSTFIDNLRKSFGRRDVDPFSVGFSMGVPKAPHEWIVTNLTPTPDPGEERKGRRLKVVIEYRGVDPDKGVSFLQDIKGYLDKVFKML